MQPEQILACLRSHPDAYITSFHRSIASVGRGRLSGGATGGCTLNYKDSFYKGLGDGFETVSVHIPLTYVLNMRHLLTEERWEAKELSAKGIIYRLKPEFMPATPTPFCSTNEELIVRRQECLRLLSAA
ncbi:TPA: hypothetical protein ACPZRY_004166 [Yersinia enterocolitica]|uniref:Uncharacterized protein n=1 Tax=Yersinia enterocolitica TaxID=630 RepID=A0AAD2V586_YEREN|nr:hypothetical protein [Yersinia enterocolitica]EKN3726629.1 hypothetical protein [Yersinia enterocolitica]EKN4811106.1 hypothetical protein [Yersinia enterocolitica]EKN5063801.1 hypothetical protein [Yersinia enterocolitica]ELI8104644.1 hypothetical protein [Yersinia enterocolitica]CQR19504.1 Uncharacterised protein [Yersinia enterocolitica]